MGGTSESLTFGDRPPLELLYAVRAVGRSVVWTGALFGGRRLRQPKTRVGETVHFADGTEANVYRETVVRRPPSQAPAVLVVTFRLRWIRGRAHAVFRAESVFNTPLFVGFPGFVSKLWLTHDERGRYRGIYEWDDSTLADSYARALWWVLALVCPRETIRYTVLAGRRRDDWLSNPDRPPVTAKPDGNWWRPVRAGAGD